MKRTLHEILADEMQAAYPAVLDVDFDSLDECELMVGDYSDLEELAA